MIGQDPWTGEEVTSTRHRVEATRVVQDASDSVFLNDDGEVLATWSTELVAGTRWPESVNPDPDERLHVGSVEWREALQAKNPSSYEPWTEQEDDRLKVAFERGDSGADLSASHQRTAGAIRSRVMKLGFVRAMTRRT